MNISITPTYQPQADRLGLLHRGIGIALLSVLMVFLSVYVSQVEPKTGLFIATFCLLIGGKRLLSPTMWPILALVGYGAFMNIFFPGPKPDFGTVLEHPLFLLDCVLLSALVLGGQSVGRQYALLLGILVISVIGAVGDVRGHDMTALLPFELPDDPLTNVLILQQGDVVRIRGFFTEAGVLCAVSIGVASMLSLGAILLINSRVCLRAAWIGLIGAITMGGIILCIAVTKSGFVMIAACCLGFIAVLVCSRNPRCRFIAVGFFAAMIVGGGLFLLVGPPTLTGYLRGEMEAAVNPLDMTPDQMGGHSGTITRYKCWALTFTSLRTYPFGVGAYGLGSVVQNTGGTGLNREMRFYFSRDNFGLKNALANLIAQNGIVGLGLLGYWILVAFIRPLRHFLADGSTENTLIAGLYGASALTGLVFLFSCELYPSFAFLLVLKFHADAVAQACALEHRADVETLELIG